MGFAFFFCSGFLWFFWWTFEGVWLRSEGPLGRPGWSPSSCYPSRPSLVSPAVSCTTSQHLGPVSACVACSCTTVSFLVPRSRCVLCVSGGVDQHHFLKNSNQVSVMCYKKNVQTSLAHPLGRLMDDERRRPPRQTEHTVDAPRLRVLG